jgi:hypothetical protein
MLIGVTVVILGRAHYVLYVLKRGNRFSTVMTWLATFIVVGFWSWNWLLK